MLKKGDRTRAEILETAKGLFSEKGYAAVTMKDFCDRLEMSRGGLYRHFASTKEIFIAMLDLDKEQSAKTLDQAIAAEAPPEQLFNYFIEQQKQTIQQGGGRLTVAVYEFCTFNPEHKPYFDRRFSAAVEMLEKLIRYGQANGVFVESDARAIADHIVVFIEGLRLSSAVNTFTDTMIDDQLRYIHQMVVKVEQVGQAKRQKDMIIGICSCL